MAVINVFSDKKYNKGIFNGKSTSGNTYIGDFKKMDVNTRDQLISNSISCSLDSDSYILCAFGPLLTNMKVCEIYDAIEFAIQNIDFDILYLTIYSDDCSLNSDIYSYENMVFKRTISPHGTECILISPKGMNNILELVEGKDGRGYDFYLNCAAEKMMLYTTFPPIMMVDVSKRTDDTKIIKSSVCKEIISFKKPLQLTQKYNGNMNLFWFFLIVVFILFIAAMFLSFSDSKSFKTERSAELRDPIPMGKQKAAELLSPYI